MNNKLRALCLFFCISILASIMVIGTGVAATDEFGSLKVTVVDTTDSYNPIRNAEIEVTAVNGTYSCIQKTTLDGDGSVEFRSIPLETYSVKVSKEGYFTQVESIAVTSQSQITQLSVYLLQDSPIIITVTDELTGLPIVNAEVRVNNADPKLTDAYGRTYVVMVRGALNTILVTANKYQPYSETTYISYDDTTLSISLTLTNQMKENAPSLNLGWNIISIPKQLSSAYDTAGELFTGVNTTGHAILSYNCSTKTWEQITASTKITPLNAYWIYSNESKTLPYEFSSSVSSPAIKSVYKGWNAIGLSADEPLSASLTFGNTNWYTYLEWNASTQGFEKPIIKGGAGEYAETNLVSLWTGGWLFLNEDGTYMGFTA